MDGPAARRVVRAAAAVVHDFPLARIVRVPRIQRAIRTADHVDKVPGQIVQIIQTVQTIQIDCTPLDPDERPFAKLGDRLLQLLPGVHDDRPVPRNRLLERLAGNQQEPEPLVSRLNDHFVAAVEQDKRSVACIVPIAWCRAAHVVCLNVTRPGRVTKRS